MYFIDFNVLYIVCEKSCEPAHGFNEKVLAEQCITLRWGTCIQERIKYILSTDIQQRNLNYIIYIREKKSRFSLLVIH